MASRREELAKLSLDDLADVLSNTTPDSINHGPPMAEFVRRQTIAQQEAANAQWEAATAAKETAQFTRRTACYMLVSVVVATLAVIVSALSLWVHH